MQAPHRCLEKLMQEYISAWHTNNWDAWGQLFEERSDFISWRGWHGRIREENVTLHRDMPEQLKNQLKNYCINTESIALLSDSIALLHVKWIWQNFTENGSPPSDRAGFLTIVAKNGKDRWRIRSLHNSRILEWPRLHAGKK